MDADKCILIAIDASEASDRAVAYVAQMIHGQHGCRVLLSHVPAPMPPELLEFGGRENPVVEQHTEAALHNAQTAWLAQVRQAAQPVFARAQTRLRQAAVPEWAVETQIATPVSGKPSTPPSWKRHSKPSVGRWWWAVPPSRGCKNSGTHIWRIPCCNRRRDVPSGLSNKHLPRILSS